jgi:predicted membrane protein
MEIFYALVNLGVFHIQDNSQHLRSAQEVLTAVGLILEHLWEEHASGVGSWV